MEGMTWASTITGYAQAKSGLAWKRYPYLAKLAARLQAGLTRGGYHCLVNMPPRHGKSELCSRMTTGWFLTVHPDRRVVLGSYEAGAASSWGRKVRDDMGLEAVRPDQRGANDWALVKELGGGGMRTAGVGGPLTSYGADLLEVDDPHKNWQEASSRQHQKRVADWWDSTAYTRLEPGASVLVVQTRWNKRDLTGHLLANYDHMDWDHVTLPALALEGDPMGRAPGEALCPERFTAEDLHKIRRAIGPHKFAAMYQQQPAVEGGDIWKKEWFGTWQTLPASPDMWLQSWDATFKAEGSSQVCGQVWCVKGPARFLVHEERGRWGFLDTLAAIRRASALWPQSTDIMVVEDKANGSAIMDTLGREFPGLEACEPHGSKVARAVAVQADIAIHAEDERAGVFLPSPVTHPWVPSWLDEAGDFPHGNLDDRVDCASQALLRCRRAGGFFVAAL
jgi:predicted phage terminase large subunit-like protein